MRSVPHRVVCLLGLDDGGIDMVTLLIWGMRVSLVVGFAATFVAMMTRSRRPWRLSHRPITVSDSPPLWPGMNTE